MKRRIIIGDTKLFNAQTADGDSGTVEWPGGKGTFAVWGTFGGGTTKLQWSPDNGTTYMDVASLTAPGFQNFEISEGQLRANLGGGTGSNVNAQVQIYSDSD